MKKSLLLLSIFLLSSVSILFTQSSPIADQNRLLLILPVHNLSAKADAEKTEKFSLILWRTLYNFTLHIPSIDVPPQDETAGLEWSADNLGEIASNFQASFIIASETKLENSRLFITVFVWDSVKSQIILRQSYETGTDYELLDTLDTIIDDSVGAVLNTPVAIASLNFTDIKISDKPIDIFINGKKHVTVGKSGFSDTLKILAGFTYKIEFIDSDGIILNSMDVTLQGGENVKIEYSAPVNPSSIIPGVWITSPLSYENASLEKAFSFQPDGVLETGFVKGGQFVPKSKTKWEYDPQTKKLTMALDVILQDWDMIAVDEMKIHLTNSTGAELYLVKQAELSKASLSVLGIPLFYTSDDKFEKNYSQELGTVRGIIDLYFENLKGIYYEAPAKDKFTAADLKAVQGIAETYQANYVIYGELNKKSSVYSGALKVWSTQKKKDVYSEKFAFKDSTELLKKINTICDNIARKGFGLKPKTGTLLFDIPKGIYVVKISDKPVFSADYAPLKLKMTLPSDVIYTVTARIKSLKVFYKEKIFLTNGGVYTVKAAAPKTKVAQTYYEVFQNIWSVCKFGENPYKSDFFLRLGAEGLAETGTISGGKFVANGKGAWELIDEYRMLFTGLDPKKIGGIKLSKVTGFVLKQKGNNFYFILRDTMNNELGTIAYIKDPALIVNSAVIKQITAKFAGLWGVSEKANSKTYINYLKFDAKGNMESGNYDNKKFKKKKAGKWEIIDNDTLQWTINNLKAKFQFVINDNGTILLKDTEQKFYLNPLK